MVKKERIKSRSNGRPCKKWKWINQEESWQKRIEGWKFVTIHYCFINILKVFAIPSFYEALSFWRKTQLSFFFIRAQSKFLLNCDSLLLLGQRGWFTLFILILLHCVREVGFKILVFIFNFFLLYCDSNFLVGQRGWLILAEPNALHPNMMVTFVFKLISYLSQNISYLY